MIFITLWRKLTDNLTRLLHGTGSTQMDETQSTNTRQDRLSWMERKVGKMGRKMRIFAQIVAICGKGAILFAIAYAIYAGTLNIGSVLTGFGG